MHIVGMEWHLTSASVLSPTPRFNFGFAFSLWKAKRHRASRVSDISRIPGMLLLTDQEYTRRFPKHLIGVTASSMAITVPWVCCYFLKIPFQIQLSVLNITRRKISLRTSRVEILPMKSATSIYNCWSKCCSIHECCETFK